MFEFLLWGAMNFGWFTFYPSAAIIGIILGIIDEPLYRFIKTKIVRKNHV